MSDARPTEYYIVDCDRAACPSCPVVFRDDEDKSDEQAKAHSNQIDDETVVHVTVVSAELPPEVVAQ